MDGQSKCVAKIVGDSRGYVERLVVADCRPAQSAVVDPKRSFEATVSERLFAGRIRTSTIRAPDCQHPPSKRLPPRVAGRSNRSGACEPSHRKNCDDRALDAATASAFSSITTTSIPRSCRIACQARPAPTCWSHWRHSIRFSQPIGAPVVAKAGAYLVERAATVQACISPLSVRFPLWSRRPDDQLVMVSIGRLLACSLWVHERQSK